MSQFTSATMRANESPKTSDKQVYGAYSEMQLQPSHGNSQKVVFMHQLTLGHNDMAWVLHKTRNIGKDFMEHKNSIKQKILDIEAFCRTVDVHSKKSWISG